MSNEIRVNANVTCTNGSYTDSFLRNIQVNQATANGTRPGIVCTTTDTALSFPGISAFGFLCAFNQDPVNYVQIGPDNSGAILPMVRVGPGEVAVMRIVPGITLRAQAHTASCDVMFWMLEN